MSGSANFTGQQIIDLAVGNKMSLRPEYYAGYGNDTSNLDSQKLEQIYNTVKEKIGDDAAAAFIRLVENLTAQNDMSASTFLSEFYRFADNGYKYGNKDVIKDVIKEDKYKDVTIKKEGGNFKLTAKSHSAARKICDSLKEQSPEHKWAGIYKVDKAVYCKNPEKSIADELKLALQKQTDKLSGRAKEEKRAPIYKYGIADACADAVRKKQDPTAFLLAGLLGRESSTPASAISGSFLREHGIKLEGKSGGFASMFDSGGYGYSSHWGR